MTKKFERTEDEIVGKLPIKVKLGDADYDIKPRTILAAREWRKLLTESMKTVIEGFMPAADSSSVLEKGLANALLQFPEKVADLVFAYAPDLPKDKILEEATEEQLAIAYSRIMTVAYPFLAQLGATVKALQEQVIQ